jgi:hypothetical protein
MHVFPPDSLPGVGVGSALSVVGLGGLVGLAAASGAMLAEGFAGVVIWVALALGAFEADPQGHPFGGRTVTVLCVLAVLVLIAGTRTVLARGRASTPKAAAAVNGNGATPRRPGTKAVAAVRSLDLVAVLIGAGAAGLVWADWNNLPLSLGSAESWTGLAVGLVAGAVGGHAAYLFTEGSVRGGGARGIVVGTVIVAGLVLDALSLYVPFAGFAAVVACGVLATRLGRQAREKHQGLRILK